MPKPVKVSVNLAQQDVLLLSAVSASTGMSRSEVIRHALGLERLAQEIRNSTTKRLLLLHGCQQYVIPV